MGVPLAGVKQDHPIFQTEDEGKISCAVEEKINEQNIKLKEKEKVFSSDLLQIIEESDKAKRVLSKKIKLEKNNCDDTTAVNSMQELETQENGRNEGTKEKEERACCHSRNYTNEVESVLNSSLDKRILLITEIGINQVVSKASLKLEEKCNNKDFVKTIMKGVGEVEGISGIQEGHIVNHCIKEEKKQVQCELGKKLKNKNEVKVVVTIKKDESTNISSISNDNEKKECIKFQVIKKEEEIINNKNNNNINNYIDNNSNIDISPSRQCIHKKKNEIDTNRTGSELNSIKRMTTRSQSNSEQCKQIKLGNEPKVAIPLPSLFNCPLSQSSRKRIPTHRTPKLTTTPEPQCFPFLFPDAVKLSDGVAKITPPKGWWDMKGIGSDPTGRGPNWARGTKNGDLLIPQPIKQCCAGMSGAYECSMVTLKHTTVAEYREKADEYKKIQLGNMRFNRRGGNDDITRDNNQRDGNIDDRSNIILSDEKADELARQFWRRLGPTMEPSVYGADIEGSFFGNDHACGWNVNQLDNCLQLLGVDIDVTEDDDGNGDHCNSGGTKMFHVPGVTTAYLYFGMWASIFAAHVEDVNLLSINYLHAGSPKYWYALDPADAGRFESLVASKFPTAAAECPEFLRHKMYLLSPSTLTRAGIGYTTMVQRVGDVVVTFPGSYHFGFNTGFNVAESTNFAVPEWMPWGDAAGVCMCQPHSVRVNTRRLRVLLEMYETDVRVLLQQGKKMPSYREWAQKEFDKKKLIQGHRKAKGSRTTRYSDYKDSSSSNSNHKKEEEKLTSAFVIGKKGALVEVLQYIPPGRGVGMEYDSNRLSSKKKKCKRTNTHLIKDLRLACLGKPSKFVKHTHIICLLSLHDLAVDSQEKDSSEKEGYGNENLSYFTGVVTSVADGHVRIHFDGTTKKHDMWLDAKSPNLYLDGGPKDGDLPPMKKDNQSRKRKNVRKRKEKIN